jgi:hypothetical protein
LVGIAAIDIRNQWQGDFVPNEKRFRVCFKTAS